MKKLKHNVDLLVIGGGVSGTVAAISAARHGVKTILIENRPCLGGPSSSECSCNANGIHVNGASEYVNYNARECGIIEEMKLEAFYRLGNGWEQHWSLILKEWVEKEEHLQLFLNTEAYDVEVVDNHITKVLANTLNSNIHHQICAKIIIDCSGDSNIAVQAGAEFRMGREERNEFNESIAPELPDHKTMGSSIAFRAIDKGHKVPFVAPPWALKIESDDDLPYRLHNNPKQGYWWLEYGGECNTIYDNEQIYTKLLSVLYGVWDHVKNGGDHNADNYVINWISSIPGKRESRRLMGDYIVTQNDILEHPKYFDTVAYGGWPIDIHPPEGVFSKGHPGSPPPFIFPGIFGIPFRALYSKNIDNLMMGGRNISVTHVALGSTRLMATCALCGQAIGVAAFLACKYSVSPRVIGEKHIKELQNILIEDDAVMPFNSIEPKESKAKVSSSSSLKLRMPPRSGSEPLFPEEKIDSDPCNIPPKDRRRVQYFIASMEQLNSVKIDLSNQGAKQLIKLELIDSNDEVIAISQQMVGNGISEFIFDIKLIKNSQYALRLEYAKEIYINLHNRHLPGLKRKLDGCYVDNNNWCFETDPPLELYPASNATNGIARPNNFPNIWISEEGFPQYLELNFDNIIKVNGVELIFDTNLNKPNFKGTQAECVKDYDIEAYIDNQWQVVACGRNNYQRRCQHFIDNISVKRLRLKVIASNGDKSARVYEFKTF